MRLIGYYASWSIYGRKYFLKDLPAEKLTHVTFAFALPKADGTLDVEELRKIGIKRDGRIKIGVAIGGWGTSEAFLAALNDNMTIFIDSCLKLVEEFGLDYLEIDWEYPQTKEQTNLLGRLLNQLKERLLKGKELSVCLPCFKSNFSAKELVPFVDFFVLMAYDLVGSWSEHSGHHSALFPSISEHCEYLIKEERIPKDKIVLSCPLYARTFASCIGPNQKFSGAGKGSFGEAGVMDYKECVEQCKEIIYDPKSVACYAINDTSFLSFDGPESIRAKCRWVMEYGFGGLAFWHVSADASGDESLISAAATELMKI